MRGSWEKQICLDTGLPTAAGHECPVLLLQAELAVCACESHPGLPRILGILRP